MCKIKHVKLNYINIKINGRKQQDRKTTTPAIRYRINQEIKFLYCKKQHLNQQLYNIHLECAQHYDRMWQYVQNNIDSKLSEDMNKLYERLNCKLDLLTQKTKNQNKHKENTQTENSRVINLTNITFTKEQINTLKLGPQYAIEKNPKLYINALITDMENAIRHLQSNIQNTFQHLTAKKIKQIKESNRHNTLHKRHQHYINQIKKILQHNLTIAKADKRKAIVIIDKTELKQKIDMFIQETNIIKLNKDPTESYHRQLQKKKKKCEDRI
jgi:hypothetical protein